MSFIIGAIVGINLVGFLIFIFLLYTDCKLSFFLYPAIEMLVENNTSINVKAVKIAFTILFFPAIILYIGFSVSIIIVLGIIVSLFNIITQLKNNRRKRK